MGRELRIISGGQTGVDRGALDAAIETGVPHGGFCPSGRLAEDGEIPSRYHLKETESRSYSVRTEANVKLADGTLILCHGAPSGGTKLTLQLAMQHQRPFLVVDLSSSSDYPASLIATWVESHDIATLNVAGPRESGSPGISARTKMLIGELLRLLA